MEMTSYPPGTPCWVDLAAPDPAVAAAFYGALFGWESEAGAAEFGGYRSCTLRGHAVAGIGQLPDPPPPPGRPWWTSYVSVTDADATAAAVGAAGGTVLFGPHEVPGLGRFLVFADTVGAVCAAWQPVRHIGAQLVNEPGTLCWNELTTREVEPAKRFYGAVFGWDVVDQRFGSTAYVAFTLGGREIAGMMPMDAHWPAEIPAHWMVYFAVDDTDATAARAAELGGSVSVPPTDIPPGRFAVLDDPQGATFSVIAMTPQARADAGG